MGGGQSAPAWPKRTVIRPNTEGTQNINKGLQLATSEQCAYCSLAIDRGVSASTAKLIINPSPDANGQIPVSASDKTLTVPNIYQPSNSITIIPSSPFTGSFNPSSPMPYGVGAIWWDSMELFWGAPLRAEGRGGPGVQGDACLLVRSSTSPVILMIPVQKTSDAGKKGCAFFNKIAPALLPLSGNQPPNTAYDPAQDPHIAGDWAKLGSGDKSVDAAKVNAYIRYASDGHYDTGTKPSKADPYASTTVDTGSGWSLNSLVAGNEGYYTWIDTIYSLKNDGQQNQMVGGMIFDTTFMKWAPAQQASNQTMGNLTPRVVYFQDPVYILETDFASLRGSVPARDPSEIVQSLVQWNPNMDKNNPDYPNHVYYHPACCGAAGAQQQTTMAQAYAQASSQQMLDRWNMPAMQWALSFIILGFMFLFVSFLLTYTTEVPDNIFVTVGRFITGPPRVGNGV